MIRNWNDQIHLSVSANLWGPITPWPWTRSRSTREEQCRRDWARSRGGSQRPTKSRKCRKNCRKGKRRRQKIDWRKEREKPLTRGWRWRRGHRIGQRSDNTTRTLSRWSPRCRPRPRDVWTESSVSEKKAILSDNKNKAVRYLLVLCVIAKKFEII